MSTESGAEQSGAEGDDVRGILRTTQERVADILTATDRAAAEIVESANEEAAQVVAEAHRQATAAVDAKMERITSLLEGVMAKAGTVDSEFEQLRELVSQSTESLADELGIEPSPKPAASSYEEAERELAQTMASVEEQVAELESTDDRAEAVKLLAIQMIATGHTAERASERLKAEFHVEDPAAVLAEIGAPLDEG